MVRWLYYPNLRLSYVIFYFMQANGLLSTTPPVVRLQGWIYGSHATTSVYLKTSVRLLLLPPSLKSFPVHRNDHVASPTHRKYLTQQTRSYFSLVICWHSDIHNGLPNNTTAGCNSSMLSTALLLGIWAYWCTGPNILLLPNVDDMRLGCGVPSHNCFLWDHRMAFLALLIVVCIKTVLFYP